VDEVEDYFSRELKEIAKIDATISQQVTERFWANRKSIVHVLAYYRLKLKEVSEVLQGGRGRKSPGFKETTVDSPQTKD